MTESNYLEMAIPCPSKKCGSSDGAVRNQDQSVHCFSCGNTWFPKTLQTMNYTSDITQINHEIESIDLDLDGSFKPLKGPSGSIFDRNISAETCEFFNVKSTQNSIILPFYSSKGEIVAQKIRTPKEKKGFWKGSPKEAVLFGANKFSKGPKITITEGEMDCLAVKDMMGDWPVVSIVNGAQSAVRDIKKNLEYFDNFKEVVICFDNDEHGRAASEKVAQIFPIGKAKIVNMRHYKDANEYLLNNATQEFKRCWFEAKEYTPAGIVFGTELLERIKMKLRQRKENNDVKYPFEELNKLTYGIRTGEMVTLVAGCVDKDTEFLTPTGWKKISEYQKGDKVGQVSQQGGGFLDFVEPEEFIKTSSTHLWHIKTKYGIDQVLSDEHRVPYITADGRHHIEPLNVVKDKHEKQVTGFRGLIETSFFRGSDLNSTKVNDNILRLMIAVVADGHFPNKKDNKCLIRLKKNRKKERLITLLERAKVSFTRKPCAPFDGFELFTFFTPFKMKDFSSNFWWNLDNHSLGVFRDEVLFWDGNQKNTFSTRTPISADFVQFAFHASGEHRAAIQYYDRKNKGVDIVVNVTKRHRISFRKTLTSKPEFKKYIPDDGLKYCFKVPSGLLLLRRNGNVFITGNSGIGKSSLLAETIHHILKTTDKKVGVMMMEESVEMANLRLMSIEACKPLHLPDTEYDEEDLDTYAERTIHLRNEDDEPRVISFDHFGSNDIETILSKVDYMAALGAKYIFLDHISILVSDQSHGDERKALDEIATKLRTKVQERDICLFLVSHLRRPGGKPHEEGGETSLADIRGTAGIGQLSDIVLGFERDQQHDNEFIRNTTKVRVLKNRFSGMTGLTSYLFYNKVTGRLEEIHESEYNDSLNGTSTGSTEFQNESGYDISVFDNSQSGTRVAAERKLQ